MYNLFWRLAAQHLCGYTPKGYQISKHLQMVSYVPTAMFYTHAEFSEVFSQAVLLLAVSMETWCCLQNISDLTFVVMMPFTLSSTDSSV